MTLYYLWRHVGFHSAATPGRYLLTLFLPQFTEAMVVLDLTGSGQRGVV